MNFPEQLNNPALSDRLAALRDLAITGKNAGDAGSKRGQEVNNHVHTFYSFSPYSPSAAAARAQAAGLLAVGIMDHDSLAGAEEMLGAGRILGIATTCGFELRVNATGTPLQGRKFNNPDSPNILYMTVHGIPARSFHAVAQFLKPLQAAREARDRLMVDKLGSVLPSYGIDPLDWHTDVWQASRASEGGSITERHILYAVARKVVRKTGTGKRLLSFLRDSLGIVLSPRMESWLGDESNPVLLYDLLGLLKSSFLSKVFVQPNDTECIPVRDAVEFAERIGGIPCYAYLGDVTDSPTGDKKAEQFEDSFLDELMVECQRLGFRAITYMPPRNTIAQLRRVQGLCAQHGFMEISGVDINSPRQSFNCPELTLPEFAHLLDATWALIAHEKLVNVDERLGLFHPNNPLAGRTLSERILAYAKVGTTLDPRDSRPATEHPLVAGWMET
ncbi:MAG TPA: PHP domain-containing protein [Spirochaetia bacterium]|nr:PHP domain-containing protein [Spirochaetia bacterium]